MLDPTSRPWIGATDEERNKPIYIGILALGWAYILSARLVEIQMEGAEMLYTNSTTPGDQEQYEHAPIAIDIGEVDGEVANWWMTILALKEGWKAIISRQDGDEFLSPWSISRKDTNTIEIHWRSHSATVSNQKTPLSSRQTFDALAQFALLHNLGSQFLAGLATTLTFPCHNYHGTTIRLPLATEAAHHDQARYIKSEGTIAYEELPHYITLSSNPEVVVSSLCGMFWEDGIPSNLVSPWLHPVINELPRSQAIGDNLDLSYFAILAILCCLRRPQLSSLWLGAVTSGLTSLTAPRTLGTVRHSQGSRLPSGRLAPDRMLDSPSSPKSMCRSL